MTYRLNIHCSSALAMERLLGLLRRRRFTLVRVAAYPVLQSGLCIDLEIAGERCVHVLVRNIYKLLEVQSVELSHQLAVLK